jgi:hypothetical protein
VTYDAEDFCTAMVSIGEAIELAKGKGYEAVGWTLQRDLELETFAFWLYRETEDEQIPLFDEVGEGSTLTEAAQACLQAVVELQHGLQVDVGEA